MAYRNDRVERARLYRQWILQEDRPCAICGARGRREIGHKVPYSVLPVTSERTCQVECYECNRKKNIHSKFKVGDRVCINGRTPAYITLSRFTPRTVVRVRYDPKQECNFYTLGSNGRGETRDGQPLEGIQYYEFRSYMLVSYQPRKYGRRKYRLKPDDSRLVGNLSMAYA